MRNVIIVGVHRGLNEVDPIDIKQECGRSGRVGLDEKGDAYILLPGKRFKYYQHWCENIPPITSTMNNPDMLAFHLVSEIAQDNVNDISTLMDWFNRSLAAFQNNYLDRIEAEELLEKLVKIKILEKDEEEKYTVTKLGMVASVLYFSPYSVAGWYFNFNKIFKEEIVSNTSISWALANISENFKDFVDKKLQDEIDDYKYSCTNLGLEISDGIAVKGLYFYACLTNSSDVDNVYKNNVKFDIERIITALKMIDNSFSFWKRETFFKKLELRIKYEIPENMTELCNLKGIGSVFVRDLFDANITRPQDLLIKEKTAKRILGKRYKNVLADNKLV